MKVHAVNAGDQCGWQQGHAGHRENFDDLVLIDIDEAHGGIHQKVDLVKQKSGVAVQRLDVAQNLTRFLKLFGIEHLGAHHEADGSAGVHHIAPDAPVQVFLAGDGPQHLAGQSVGDDL